LSFPSDERGESDIVDNTNTFRGGGHVCRELKPARVTPPGRILSWELDARGWTNRDLAEMMSCPDRVIDEIVQGTQRITPKVALQLAEVFGMSPELWIRLEANRR
jgi:addiction module HigA family antidote